MKTTAKQKKNDINTEKTISNKSKSTENSIEEAMTKQNKRKI